MSNGIVEKFNYYFIKKKKIFEQSTLIKMCLIFLKIKILYIIIIIRTTFWPFDMNNNY